MIERVQGDRTALWLAMSLGGLIALVLVIIPGVQAALVVIAVGVVLLAILDRRAALYFIIPAMALSPEMPTLGVPVRLEDFLMIPLALGWLARMCIVKERQGTPVDRLLIAYVLVGLAATLWGGYLGTAHFMTTNKFISSPFHFFKRIEFVLLFFIITETLTTVGDVSRFTYVLMGSMALMNLYGLSQFLSNQYIALAPEGAPIHEPGLAAMLNVVLAISLLPSAKGVGRLFLAGILLFSLAVLPLGLGRNFLVSTALVVLYVGVWQRQRWVLALVPIAVLAARVFYPAHVIQRILTLQHVFTPDESGTVAQGASLVYRVFAPAYYSFLALGNSPALGFGLAAIPLGFIDSEYVVQFFYTGIVGLAIFLLLGVRLFRLAKAARQAAKDALQTNLARGFQLALVAYSILSVFSASVSASRSGGFFFVVIALLAVLHRALTQPGGGSPTAAG